MTSVDEELRPLPSSYRGPALRPLLRIDAAAVVRRYAALRDAGVIQWVHEQRGIAYIRSISASRPVLQAWVRTLEPAE